MDERRGDHGIGRGGVKHLRRERRVGFRAHQRNWPLRGGGPFSTETGRRLRVEASL